MSESNSSQQIYVSPCAEQRLAAAAEFLRGLSPTSPVLILAATPGAAQGVVLRALGPESARAGWFKHTLDTLAAELALRGLARAGLTLVRGLGVEAVCTRVVSELAEARALGRYAEIGQRPGFVRALAQVITELRLALVGPQELVAHDADLAALLGRYEAALADNQLCDRAGVLREARRAVAQDAPFLVRMPCLALDVPLVHQAEAELARALGAVRRPACATVARGDDRSEVFWSSAFELGLHVQRLTLEHDDELARLKVRLFEPSVALAGPAESRGQVKLLTSPGESREAVEIAREIRAAAARGIAFDQMAIFLRAVDPYRDVVEEALARAEVPAHFADGVRRPAPQGRAFLALLTCAREGLSARAFAEYLSLGMAPWEPAEEAAQGAAEEPVVRANPRRWEQYIVEAAVIGGRERWERRLQGLVRSSRAELTLAEAGSPEQLARELRVQQLEALLRFSGPILDALASLPARATWGDWLEALESLARKTLREPDAVCDTLLELAPLAPVGPVGIEEVERVLSRRLVSVLSLSTGSAAGKVFVGAVEDAPGRAFDLVFVPGLAEKMFPPRILEDPLLGDPQRRALGAGLLLTDERAAKERLALRLFVGAARKAVVLSFPRFDVEHGRPRVPSFYGLEVLRAVDGQLPAFDELTRRADPGAAARMGWPAPKHASLAIDDAEYDLAVLDHWRGHAGEKTGGARYALLSNPHLARALRFRARRWESQRFNVADGLVLSKEAAQRLMPSQRLRQRPYSASSLSLFASCPYRFFLHAIMGVAEREEVSEIDELDPRQRGVLFHAVQREVLRELSRRALLPLPLARLPEAQQVLTHAFEVQAERARDSYAPAVQRVFDLALTSIRDDLTEWLRRTAEERYWIPQNFELGFGLKASDELAPESAPEPILLSIGLRLRGAIDLVERRVTPSSDGRSVLRATDHKTGSAAEKPGAVTSGGRMLQPLLYALALEKRFPEAVVDSGRLYFCTTQAGFSSHEVPLTELARTRAKEIADAIDALLAAGFLPAAPGGGRGPDKPDCEHCSYRVVCGPYEAERVGRVKGPDLGRLAPLHHVRSLP